jgi:hypothetical protein
VFINSKKTSNIMKVNGSSYYPVNTSCEVVIHVTGGQYDIFGDLPLLESANIIKNGSGAVRGGGGGSVVDGELEPRERRSRARASEAEEDGKGRVL